ncbi:MAG: methylmalonyl-CoA mutase family protein [Prevotellaceae bacterium]|jgi:methylmalonyl-CoA mutase|nr:methylmalonyl-CoA mutase family protein [Prevotellaceae bacterium]
MSEQKLFTEFQPVATEQWEAVIGKDLKGADYEKKLVWKPLDGLKVRPYYRAENLKDVAHASAAVGEFPYVRGVKGDNQWRTCQTYCACNSVAEANAQALDGLMKGVDAVSFCVKKDITDAELEQLLKGIYLDVAELNLVAQKGCGMNLAEKLVRYAKQTGVDLSKLRLSVSADPLRVLTVSGHLCDDAFGKLKNSVLAAAEVKHLRTIGVSGATLHNAGANAVQELALALSMGNEYLVQLTDQGLSVDQVAPRIRFTLAVGASYFLEIAKIRAARILWANVVKAYKPAHDKAAKMSIHAVTSAWNQTAYDAYVNLLRGTTEAMSAAIAGVDSIEVLRFDKPFKSSSDFSNRIARNTQILLKEEVHFDHVADPSAGSYYIECLTQSLAEEAWKLFRQVEDMGGYIAAFKAGFVQAQVKASAALLDKNLASRRATLLGTNQYPNFGETLNAEATEKLQRKCCCKPDATSTSSPSCSADSECCEGDKPQLCEPLSPYRGAEVFEAMRMKTEAAKKRPEVFMLTFGNLAMCRARAQFSSNFFAVAGFKVTDNNQFATVEEGVQAALAAKAEIVVACSSDEDYAEGVPKIYEALKGKAIVVVAGEPECKAELQSKGLSHFISVKSNVLETLQGYQTELGI